MVITTRVPFGPLLADLAMPSFAIVSPKSMRDDPVGLVDAGVVRRVGHGTIRVPAGLVAAGSADRARAQRVVLDEGRVGRGPAVSSTASSSA